MIAVSHTTAEGFQAAYNAAVDSLGGNDFETIWNLNQGHCCYIIYKETKKTPTTVKEEFEERGEVYHCYECPFMDKIRDMRRKYVECKTGFTNPHAECCDYFYNGLARGEFKPVRGWEE